MPKRAVRTYPSTTCHTCGYDMNSSQYAFPVFMGLLGFILGLIAAGAIKSG